VSGLSIANGKKYIPRSKAVRVIGNHLYGEDRTISIKLLDGLIKEGRLEQLLVGEGPTKRHFISVASIEKFLEDGSGRTQVVA
jgi:hypothetical protein